jgi:hypothetical protein
MQLYLILLCYLYLTSTGFYVQVNVDFKNFLFLLSLLLYYDLSAHCARSIIVLLARNHTGRFFSAHWCENDQVHMHTFKFYIILSVSYCKMEKINFLSFWTKDRALFLIQCTFLFISASAYLCVSCIVRLEFILTIWKTLLDRCKYDIYKIPENIKSACRVFTYKQK